MGVGVKKRGAQCPTSDLAARLALQLQCSKSKATTSIHQRLNLTLAMLEPCSPVQGFSIRRTRVEVCGCGVDPYLGAGV